MNIKINYSKNIIKKTTSSHVFFTDEKLDLNGVKKNLSRFEFNYVSDILKTGDPKKRLFTFDINSKKKIIIIPIKDKFKVFDYENLGAELYNYIKTEKKGGDYLVFSESVNKKYKNFFRSFSSWIKIKILRF